MLLLLKISSELLDVEVEFVQDFLFQRPHLNIIVEFVFCSLIEILFFLFDKIFVFHSITTFILRRENLFFLAYNGNGWPKGSKVFLFC